MARTRSRTTESPRPRPATPRPVSEGGWIRGKVEVPKRPAGHRAVGLHRAGMLPPGADLCESPRGRPSAILTPPPTGQRGVGLHAARFDGPAADLGELPR